MTSATEELRRMLTEEGIEWKAWDGVHPITVWHDETYSYEFVEYRLTNGAKQISNCPCDNDGHCELTIKVFNCTPAQAIAATLGSGTCKADETDTWECVRDDLGGYGKTMTVHVMECSACGGAYEYINGGYEFCPRCRAKVVDA